MELTTQFNYVRTSTESSVVAYTFFGDVGFIYYIVIGLSGLYPQSYTS